jgi:hypothetical protein
MPDRLFTGWIPPEKLIGWRLQKNPQIAQIAESRFDTSPLIPMTRSRPLARPVAGLCRWQIPFVASLATQVPVRGGEEICEHRRNLRTFEVQDACDPSQNGLLAELPQRHKVSRFRIS